MSRIKVSTYNYSNFKRFFDIFFSAVLLCVMFPIIVLISICIVIFSGFPVFFLQLRTGINGKRFKVYKFRTMVKNAEKMQSKLKNLNEADGPVFKIRQDPRFTNIGLFLSKTGLDELPQFINILIGDMSVVGPRPLPVAESKKMAPKYKVREKIKPGATSTWVTEGSHRLSFEKWMKLDRDYVANANLLLDIKIIMKTSILMVKYFFRQLTNH